jgi:hypothetical protein
MEPMTDDEIRTIWRSKGGSFHGPHIETGTMPEAQLLPFLRELLTIPYRAMLVQPELIKAGGQYLNATPVRAVAVEVAVIRGG